MDKIIAVVGPTGIGKTSLSLKLAKELKGEIISGDSMQVYSQMNIGTAKILPDQMEGIIHHLVGIQNYSEPYNVKIFQNKSRQAIQEILKKGKVPIFCGGTGLYLKAALYDYEFEEEEPDLEYTTFLNTLSNETLYSMLEEQDPKAAKTIHPHNRKRVIRALQIVHSGLSKSQREDRQEHRLLYDVYFIGLDMNRDQLYARIDQRVEEMFEQGLPEEVCTLFKDPKTWEYTSFQGIGYKEFRPYLEGKTDLASVKKEIQKHSRQYAKRQYTWFKNQMPVHWFDKNDLSILDAVKEWYYGK